MKKPLKVKDVVVDDTGRHYAVVAVKQTGLTLRDVATKQEYIKVRPSSVTLVPGLREAL